MSAFIRKNYSVLFLGAILISFQIIELSYMYTPLGKLGVIIWYGLIIFLFIQTFKDFLEIIKISFSKKSYFSLFTYFLIPGIVIFYYVNQATNLSLEATQQIACSINNFSLPDWGYFQNCFLGYPARQFYLALIPSAISRDVFNLNLGNYLYFLIGWTIFVNASIKRMQTAERNNDLLLTLFLFYLFISITLIILH